MPSADAQDDIQPGQQADPVGSGEQGVGPAPDHRERACQPRPGFRQPDQCRGHQQRIDDQQHPRAPRHRRGRLEGQVHRPDVKLVREIEEQRAHAEVQQHERRQRRVQREVAPGVLATHHAQHGDAAEDHQSGDDAADEQVQRNLPAPHREVGIHQRVVTGRRDLEHGRLRSGRRRAAGCRPRAAACATGACAAASPPCSSDRRDRRRPCSGSDRPTRRPGPCPP